MSMEFVPSDEGPRPTIPQPTPGPNFDETLGAAFRQGNSVVSAFQALRSSGPYEPQEGYSAWDEIKDKPQYLPYANRFAGFHSPGETQELMAKIDAEERDKRTLAASGSSGFLAAMIAGTLDPTMLLPGRVVVGAMKEGVPLLRGAAEIGTAMAVQSTAQEAALQTSQVTRPVGESVLNVGSATVLGALLGSSAALLSPAEHANLVTALDRDRAAIDAHAAGRPEPSPEPPAPTAPTGFVAYHGSRQVTKNDMQDIRRQMFREATTVQELLAPLERGINPADASRILKEAGIPGIKYLDEQSRKAGEGTRNYVIFDDRLVTKTGAPPVPAEAIAAPAPPAREAPAAPAPAAAPEEDMATRLQRAATEGGGLSGYLAQREAMVAEARAALAARAAARQEAAAAPDVLRDALQERQRAEVAAVEPDPAALPPRTPFPENFPTLVFQQGPQSKVRLTEHPDFEAAKGGDVEAATRVVQTAMRDDQVEKIRRQIGDRNPVLVPVHEELEGGNRNVLPMAYAEELHHRLGYDVDLDIVQVHRVRHTGAPAAVRIANRTGFEGRVEPGRDYYLVDDMAVQGGTLADLRSHIEANGGNVIGGTALMGSPYSHILGPRAETLAKLRAKFPDLEAWWHEHFGHGFDAITESEAHYLTRFGTADAVRNRVLEETQANDLGAAARAKGSNLTFEERPNNPIGFWRRDEDEIGRGKEGLGLQLIRRFHALGMSGSEISEQIRKLGYRSDPRTVQQVMKKYDLKFEGPDRKSAIDLDKAYELYKQGKTYDEIADELGTTYNTVYYGVQRGRDLEQPIENVLPKGALSEWEIDPATGVMTRRLAGSAGAAATDVRTLEPVRTGLGLERVAFDPVLQTLQSPSVSARRAMADLAEVPILVGENLRGETTTLGGMVPLETMGRVVTNKTTVAVHDKLLGLWEAMRFEGGKMPFAKRAQLAFGLPERAGSEAAPSLEQFKEMVSDALMNGDVHAVPQVQEAAQFIRRTVFEPWAERAEKAFPQFQRQEAEDYFPHVWNKNKIEAQRPEFVNKLLAKLWGDQTAKRGIQGRLRSFQGALEVHQDTIDNLTDRIDKRNASLKEAQTELEAASRAHREMFKRATELREQGTEAARQKAIELGSQENKLRSEIEKIDKRASGYQHEIEDLEHRLQAEHLSANRVRERIEEEIGRWEGKSASEAKSAIKAREKYEAERQAKAAEAGKPKPTERLKSADADVDRAVKRILKTDQNRSLEDIRDQSNEIVDRLLGSPDGRLAYDEHRGAPDFGPRVPGAEARGSLARRTLDVDNEFARGWIEQDIERVVRDHLRTFVPDVLLAERFGDVEMSEQMRGIQDEFAHMIDTTKNEADRVKLGNQRDKAIENVAAIRDRFRGLYNIPSTAAARRLGRISAAVKNANIPLSLGMATISSIPDAAGAVFRWGMTAAFRDGWAPFVRSLMSDRKFDAEAMRQFRAMGIAVDTLTAQRHHEFSGLVEAYRPGSPVERTLQWGADKFQLLNLLGPWTDRMKTISSTIAAQELYRAAKATAENKATPKQMRALAENNITPNMATRVAEQYEKSGNTIDGVTLPNTEAWEDKIAREHFEGALSREANIAVMTPGLDKPLLFSDPVFSMLLQFKSFTAGATTRIMIANLQRMDAETLQGLVASLAMGMISYKVNAITGGQPTSDRPQDWIKEAMSRGNVLGWLEEGNALASKMTRGGIDVYRLIGADKPLSKFAAQSAPEQLMGPTFGKLQAIAKATSGAAAREWDASDTKALRRLIPMQNLVYLRNLFDQVEAGTNNALGVQQKVH